MNLHDNNSSYDPSGDPLDELLKSARWAEAEPLRVRRLESLYTKQRKTNRTKRWLAAAAVVLTAVTAGMWISTLRNDADGPVVKLDSDDVAASSGPAEVTAQKEQPTQVAEKVPEQQDGEAQAIARTIGPPNAFEQLISRAARSRVQPSTVENTPDSEITAAIDEYTTAFAPDAKMIAEKHLQHSALHERQLASLALRTTGIQQRAAAALLAQIASPRSLPALMKLYEWSELRPLVSARIARLADTVTLARMIRSAPDRLVQEQLVAGLLDRRDPLGVEVYLNLLQEPPLADAAVSSLVHVDRAPVEQLLAYLQDSRVARRLAAAQTLGRLNDPAVTKRLIALAQSGELRREAIAALMHSSEPGAVEFVQRAQQDLNLLASVRAAQVRYAAPQVN